MNNWLESKWARPSQGGILLILMALFFFGAASNTMAGWLYVLSGISIALLGIAAILPRKSLNSLKIRRLPIQPVSVGDQITIELEIENTSPQPKTLLQVQDVLSLLLGKPKVIAIEMILPETVYKWIYYVPTRRRGIYRWEEVKIRTGSPLGLFWCQRYQIAKANAIVYPSILPLKSCPLIDKIGEDNSSLFTDRYTSELATQGITRNLRPYRHGDPMRLIHWRSSARLGELRVRELEISTGGQEVIIALDSHGKWESELFEQAVTVAASLYFYASKRQFSVRLWTAGTGIIMGNLVVLEALASVNCGESLTKNLPHLPLIWLSQNPQSLHELPSGSRWILWPSLSSSGSAKFMTDRDFPGLEIRLDHPLESQLQTSIFR